MQRSTGSQNHNRLKKKCQIKKPTEKDIKVTHLTTLPRIENEIFTEMKTISMPGL